jgi:hypothetical protein
MALAITPGYSWTDGEVVTAAKLNLAAAPTVALGGTYGFDNGSVSSLPISFTSDGDTGFYNPSANTLSAACNGAMVWQANTTTFTFGYSSGVTVTSTGLQGPVGATTPSTGSFTSLAVSIAGGGAASIFNASTGTAGTGMFVRLQRGGTNTWDIGTGISLGSDIFEIYNRTTSANALQISASTSALTLGSSITTSAPSGGTAAAWKLGTVASVSPTSPNRTIELDVGGTIYYLHAKTTNN